VTELKRFSKVLNWVLFLILGVVVVTLAVAAVGVPCIISGSNDSKAVREGTDLQACRAFYNVNVVEAQTLLYVYKAALDVNTSQGLTAAVNRDQARLAELTGEAPPLQAAVQAQEKAVLDATQAYKDKIKQSQSDRASFEAQCAADQKGG
jgi:hypothetical protein